MAAAPGAKRQGHSASRTAVKRRKVSDTGKGASRPSVGVADVRKENGAGKASKSGPKNSAPKAFQHKKTFDGASEKPKFVKTKTEKPSQGSSGKGTWKQAPSSGKGSAGPDTKNTASTDKPLDRKARKELKEARKKRRRAHYDLEKEVVAIWEKMRGRNVNREEKRRCAAEALKKMTGKLVELSLGHITCRVIQACLKQCRDDERTAVYAELRPHCLTLAKNTYAYHLVTKMFDHATKEQTHQMIAQLHGGVVALLRHPSASAVVEHAFNLGSKIEKQELLSEFYSPEYRLFKGILVAGTGRIADVLKAEPSKKNSVIQHMTLSLQPILEKGIVDHSIIHRAVVEYFSIASPSLMDDAIQHLAGPLLLRMIHTKDGAKVGLTCVTRGSTKERKKIVKALKGHVGKVAREEHGHVVLLAILDVVDDTTVVSKCIINGLLKELKELALDKYGRRLLLHLLAPGVPRYFPPDIIASLLPPQDAGSRTGLESAEAGCDEEEEEDVDDDDVEDKSPDKRKQDRQMDNAEEDNNDDTVSRGISKKDPILRRRELLVDSGLAKSLIDTCIEHVGELVRSRFGTDLLYEVAMGGFEGMLWTSVGSQLISLHKAIAELAAVPADGDGSGGVEHVLLEYFASRTIRRLVLNAIPPPEEVKGPSFSWTLWSTALKGRAELWTRDHSSKVVSAYKDCADTSAQTAAKVEIQKLVNAGVFQTVAPGLGSKPKKCK